MTTTMLPSHSVRVAPQSRPELHATRLPPAGYAVARLPDGRYAPGTVPGSPGESAALVCLLRWSGEIVPQALDGGQDGTDLIAFATYDEALCWCERRCENAWILLDLLTHAVQTQVYPERNVWFRDEIERRLREVGYSWPADADGPFDLSATPVDIRAWLDAGSLHLPALSLHVEAPTIDEMWEALYAAVEAAIGRSAARP